jgi:hypothetical protein
VLPVHDLHDSRFSSTLPNSPWFQRCSRTVGPRYARGAHRDQCCHPVPRARPKPNPPRQAWFVETSYRYVGISGRLAAGEGAAPTVRQEVGAA